MANTGGSRRIEMVSPEELFNGIGAVEAGQFLAEERKSYKKPDGSTGYTQAELAELAKLPHSNYLTMYERGRRDWRSSKYSGQLIEALSISAEECQLRLGMNVVFSRGRATGIQPLEAAPVAGLVEVPVIEVTGSTSANQTDTLAIAGEMIHPYRDVVAVQIGPQTIIEAGIRELVPAPSYVLVSRQATPLPRDVVLAWLEVPYVGPRAVLRFGEPREIVLESHDPTGMRAPRQLYHNSATVGVVVGVWRPGRFGG
jgi:hypothetical protein